MSEQKPPEKTPEPPNLPAPKANIQAGAKIQALVPTTIEEAFRMAESIFLAGMYPDSYAADANGVSGSKKGPTDRKVTVARIMIGIQKAMEVGLPPISGLSVIYIVNNKPTIYGDGVPGLLYKSKLIETFKEWTEGTWGQDDYTAFCEIKRKDMDEPTLRSFSYADAKKAQLLTKPGPWSLYPKRQMQMRARGWAARDGAADVLQGLSIYEEVIDIPEKRPEVTDTSSLDDEPTQHETPQLTQQTSVTLEDLKEQTGLKVAADLELADDEPAAKQNSPEPQCKTCGDAGTISMTDDERTWTEQCDCQTKGEQQ